MSPPAQRPYRGATAAERQAERRERLLAAAYECFGTEGYQATTMRRICAKARMAERYFHESFDDVHAAYLAVYMQCAAQCALATRQAREANPNFSAHEQSVAAMRAFLEFIKAEPRRARILLIDSVASGAANPRNINTHISMYLPFFKGRIRSRFPNLDLDLDMEFLAGGLVGLVISVSTLWAEKNFEAPVDKVLDHIMFAWRGMALWMDEHNPTPPPSPSPSPGETA
jgi:AcrR family transcriptional regulator